MISFVQGTLAAKEGDVIVVQAGAVGLNIHVPLSVTEQLPKTGEEVMIHTYLKVAEDALTLYGFLTVRDREMFCRLINVNGIGPKGALAILSTMTPDDLRMAVLTEDAKAISRAPGVGMKTAQRIILDLKDKISFEDLEDFQGQGTVLPKEALGRNSAASEAVEALVQLGYSLSDAGKAVRAVEGAEQMDSEQILKAALKQFRF
ncbi:MAG: Holliday junction branch migration protein RuvA [Stomatobaculum sp.]|nr:Holliday junction branch migration protein RuvA [Stomatobaculum sp.]